jgi:hypothetical protein
VAQAPTVQMQTASVNAPSQARVSFRAATMERIDILAAEAVTLSASLQPIQRTVEGAGYIYGILLQAVATGATQTAASVGVYTEDAPFNVYDTISLADANGELWNLSGFESWCVNVFSREDADPPPTSNADGAALPSSAGVGGVGTTASQDPNVVLNVGAIGSLSTTSSAGGNFTFPLRLKVAANRRDLLGLLGNQDRSQKYQLRTDIAASTVVFSTAPSSLPALAINKFYEEYSIPLPTAPDGTPQEVFPASFGTMLYHTRQTSATAPANGSQISHFLQRIGNTIHFLGLIFRSNTVSAGGGTSGRGNADINPPTAISLKLGEDVVFRETWGYRRTLMFERLGYDAPRGTLLYDWTHDFGPFAGFELGDDLIHTEALVNAQFLVTYPSTGSTWQPNSQLKFITRDDIFNQPAVAQVR